MLLQPRGQHSTEVLPVARGGLRGRISFLSRFEVGHRCRGSTKDGRRLWEGPVTLWQDKRSGGCEKHR